MTLIFPVLAYTDHNITQKNGQINRIVFVNNFSDVPKMKWHAIINKAVEQLSSFMSKQSLEF